MWPCVIQSEQAALSDEDSLFRNFLHHINLANLGKLEATTGMFLENSRLFQLQLPRNIFCTDTSVAWLNTKRSLAIGLGIFKWSNSYLCIYSYPTLLVSISLCLCLYLSPPLFHYIYIYIYIYGIAKRELSISIQNITVICHYSTC